jgi:hypothetical protein
VQEKRKNLIFHNKRKVLKRERRESLSFPKTIFPNVCKEVLMLIRQSSIDCAITKSLNKMKP